MWLCHYMSLPHVRINPSHTCKRHITHKASAFAEPTGIVKIPHAIGQLYSVMMVSTWHIQGGTAGQACRQEQACKVELRD